MSVGATQFGTLNMRKRNMWTGGPERRATSCSKYDRVSRLFHVLAVEMFVGYFMC